MEKADYSKIGLKAGLEIHQQLDTGKLFCRCPSLLRNDQPSSIITRKLHAVAGESGEVDVAAKYESTLDKEFIYQIYDENVCLVDLDEEPPRQINQEALKIALHISILLNCEIVPLTQIMRKTVVDGSNTGGFQRTVLIAKDGYVETSQGKVRIDSVFLEEDSARPVLKTESQVVYRLDRLGIPLVEIATAPDIKSPEQAKETALKIGEILRSCKVRRGIGSIRQDLNISIKGSNRVEIKGFQDPKIMVKTVENEIKRQENFLKNKEKNPSEVRQAISDATTEFLRPMPGSSRMYPETDLPLLKLSREFINETKKTLPKSRVKIKDELKETGLNQEMIKLLLKKNKLSDFKEFVQIINKPDLVAKLLLIFPKEIASHEKLSIERINKRLSKEALAFVLENLRDNKVSESQIKDVLRRIAKGTDARDAVLFKKQDLGKIEEQVMKLIKSKPGLSEKAYMGLVMKDFKGKISGKDIFEIIKKYVV